MKVAYVVDGRMPSEKAHGIFSAQMCQAFARQGAEVTLIYPRRVAQWREGITRDTTVEQYYSLRMPLRQHRLPIIDWIWLFETFLKSGGRGPLGRIGSLLTSLGMAMSLRLHLMFNRYDFVYMVNPHAASFLSLMSTRALGRKTFLDVHTLPQTRSASAMLWRTLRWLGGAVPLTSHLRDSLEKGGVAAHRMIIGPMGIDPRDYKAETSREEARRRLGLPEAGRIAAYVGKFHTMGEEKGIPEILHASAELLEDFPDLIFLFVGGPEDRVPTYISILDTLGLDKGRFIFLGMQPSAQVPLFLRASDLFLMPFPWTHHYAYYMSPMKMFEYMAAGRPLVGTVLPSVQEVLRHEHNALLAEPGDAGSLAASIRRLLRDEALGERLAHQAASDVARYSWDERARNILQFMKSTTDRSDRA